MILQLKHKETAAVVLHMSIMRKSIRNKIKKSYPAQKAELMAAYDYVLSESKDCLEYNLNHINLNIRDVEILKEFIRAYKLQIDSDKQIVKTMTEQDKEHLQLLTAVQERCRELIQDVI